MKKSNLCLIYLNILRIKSVTFLYSNILRLFMKQTTYMRFEN